ncbi:hypothetical protein KUTeg_002924 [Tegillarca granosa]|uniref:Major facilitator superfamily (MFS) profile domain-containing protein n=1 Tax=Tegillarca granosa TaxID=220873 RepID=A0ABQ9FTA9_TEGGR|nr:hypothetical protein KUTeg_002924 [Tegillarca granosa]
MCFGVTGGYVFERYGAPVTSLSAMLLALAGLTLTWSTLSSVQFYSSNVWLQCIYFFISGQACSFMYMCTMTSNINNFPSRHRGKLIGVLDGCFSAGTALISLIYNVVFNTENEMYTKGDYLKDFYLFLLIAFVIAGILGTMFLRIIPNDEQEEIDTRTLLSDSKKVEDITGFNLLSNLDFHCIFWSTVFGISLQLMFQNNLVTFLLSFGKEKHATLFTTASPVAIVFGKFFAGFISDVVLQRAPRVSVLLFFSIIQSVLLLVFIFYLNNDIILFIGMLVIALSNGSIWCLIPIIISEYFGLKHFGVNWGSVLFSSAFGVLIMQKLFGFIYESNIEVEGQTMCQGQVCYTVTFIVAFALSLVCVVLYSFLVKHKLEKNKEGVTLYEMKR